MIPSRWALDTIASWERTLDFVERILQVAPDGGSGLLEYTILLALLMPVVGLLWFGRLRKLSAGGPPGALNPRINLEVGGPSRLPLAVTGVTEVGTERIRERCLTR